MARCPLMPGSRSSPETLLGAPLKASDRSHWLGQVQALQTRLLRRKTMHKLKALVGLLQTPPTTQIDTSGSMWCGACGGGPSGQTASHIPPGQLPITRDGARCTAEAM